MNKECFITENGTERKAGLEDLFPIIGTDKWTLQHIIREAVRSRIDFSTALAFLPGEIKETVYHNVSSRTGYMLKKQVSDAETGYSDYFVLQAKAKLINLIGEQRSFSFPGNLIWREAKYKEVMAVETPPLESLKKRIEESFDSGDLRMAYCTDKISREDIENVFQNHPDDLQKIRHLEISGKDLPAAALLFEKAKIERLWISGVFDCVWPSFLENCSNLTVLVLEESSKHELTELPSWIRNASSLHDLSVNYTKKITSLPDWIGDLQSLVTLSLSGGKNLETLPDSIGNLKNLAILSLRGTSIKMLPDSLGNLKSLQRFSLTGSPIEKIPGWIGDLQSLTTLSLCSNEDLYQIAEGFFKQGLRLVVDGIDGEIIRHLMQIKSDREHDFYRKKLMEAATEGILCIYNGDTVNTIVNLLASLVDIKNNPLDAACAKYVTCDFDAFYNINFDAAIKPEGEREEIRFIKRALKLSEISRREGLLALEGNLDHEGIASHDVFEYGLPLAIDGWDPVAIRKILDNLIAHETDLVRKNIAMAKEEAVLSIYAGDNPRVLMIKLCAFFDGDIAVEAGRIIDE